jgi:NAD(P)-dependent dehydrogenase (short-subunit alcohol dehydrogenase family)
VINLSSGAHRRAAFDFNDPNFEVRLYDKWIAYAQSKTANALFSIALDRKDAQERVRSFAVHPGRIETGLQRSIPMGELQNLGLRNMGGEIPEDQLPMYKTTEQGAATTLWCAVSPSLEGMAGVYCEDIDFAKAVTKEHKELTGVMPWAIDEAFAERLWAMSERLIYKNRSSTSPLTGLRPKVESVM